MSALVSVIIPVYNAAEYLLESILSICNQTYLQLEIIVVDDASTDASVSIVQQISDSRIILVKNEINSGLAESVNKGIRLARGSYIARMDADDISLPARIQNQVKFLELNPEVGIVGTAMQSIGFSNFKHVFPETHQYCKAQLLFNVCVGHPTVMMRKCIFDNPENLYASELRQYSEEYELWCRLINRVQFANLPEVHLLYRTFPEAMKGNAVSKRKANSFQIRKTFIQRELSVDEEEYFGTHDHICNLSRASTISELNQWIQWLLTLEKLNETRDAFSKRALHYELSKRCFEIRYWNTHLGRRNFLGWLYQKKLRGYSPTFQQYVKFFVRSLGFFK